MTKVNLGSTKMLEYSVNETLSLISKALLLIKLCITFYLQLEYKAIHKSKNRKQVKYAFFKTSLSFDAM